MCFRPVDFDEKNGIAGRRTQCSLWNKKLFAVRLLLLGLLSREESRSILDVVSHNSCFFDDFLPRRGGEIKDNRLGNYSSSPLPIFDR